MKFLKFNFQMFKKKAIFLSALGSYYLFDQFFIEENQKTKNNLNENKFFNSLNYNHYNEIFEKKHIILGNEMNKYINLSTPFNRKIKYIYDLPFVYPEYENYNFNKLSDFFLNIHIFIN